MRVLFQRYLPQPIKQFIRRFRHSVVSAKPDEVERAEQTFYISYLRSGMVAFDVGANIGELSLLFSRFVGMSGKVHAFEPCMRTFDRLRSVIEASGRGNIVLNHVALADCEGMLQLKVYDDQYSGWNTLANRPLKNYNIDVKPISIEAVQAMTIDTYCKQHAISYIDLLKIDVEGAEYQVLLGAEGMLCHKAIGCCIFEFGQTTFDMGNHPSAIRKLLVKYGYRLRNVVESDPLFPGGSKAATAQFSMLVATPQ